jgi:sulfide:quinone oxidoreductase
MKTHFQIAIIGGGNAGISVAAQLLNKQKTLDIAIFDPSEKHYYQPAWTLVGGGVFDIKKTERSEKSVIPKNAKWIQESVETFDPENQRFKTKNGNEYSYDILIVAPGIQLNWNAIPGLEDSLGKNGVSSNYSFKHASYTFELIQNLKKGKAIFHNPDTPVK